MKGGELIGQSSTPPPPIDIDPQRNTVDLPPLDKGKSKAANHVLTQLRTWPMDSLATPSDDLRNENDFIRLDSPSDRGRDKGLPGDSTESGESKASIPSLSKTVGQPKDGMMMMIKLYFCPTLNGFYSHSSRRRKEGKSGRTPKGCEWELES